MWPKRELLLKGTMQKIPSGQDGPILLPQVANQNTDSLNLAHSLI